MFERYSTTVYVKVLQYIPPLRGKSHFAGHQGRNEMVLLGGINVNPSKNQSTILETGSTYTLLNRTISVNYTFNLGIMRTGLRYMIKCLDAILRASQKLTINHFERYLVLNGQVKEKRWCS